MLKELAGGAIVLPPLRIKVDLDLEVRARDRGYDAILLASWDDGQPTIYAAELKTISTPLALKNAIAMTLRAAKQENLRPMVILPYLSEERLLELEREGVSGIDLCGNAVVLGHDFRVFRTGRPNLHKDSAPIKNVYRGTSSLFVRCFLLREEFSSLGELQAFALERASRDEETFGGSANGAEARPARLSKGTASKVVKALTEDLILIREGDALRRTSVDRLLMALQSNYLPIGEHRIQAKSALPSDERWSRLEEERRRGRLRYVATGIGSAAYYGALSIEGATMVYVDDLEHARTCLHAETTVAFPNLLLIETESEVPFFDARVEGGRCWASPIQTWIELATDGPREREAAMLLQNDLRAGRFAL